MNAAFEEAKRRLSAFQELKGFFPFRLGATSYIVPADILPNVELLSTVVDEIQLLLFQSEAHSNLPDAQMIADLNSIAEERKISFAIHLPLDIYPGHEDESIRAQAVKIIRLITEIGEQIKCNRFIFHYNHRTPEGTPLRDLEAWRRRLRKSTEELLISGISPGSLCVENLAYPFSWVADLVHQYGLSCCIDLGHLRVNSFPVKRHLQKYLPLTKVVHLHGLKKGADHHGLSAKDARCVRQLLKAMDRTGYRETLILEVFQLDHLLESFETFRALWEKWQIAK